METDLGQAQRSRTAAEKRFDREFEEATRRGKEEQERGYLARSARYNRRTKRLDIELLNGLAFCIPVDLLQGIAGQPVSVIESVEIQGAGYGLHWESLDADLSVPNLVAGCFGSPTWMAALARQGGLAKTAAKRRAARENGKKGGRPRGS